MRPAYPEVLSSRGVALKELGRLDEAMQAFDAALRLKPNYPDARNNRAGALLSAGDLVQGFAAFESRWERSNAPPKTLISPLPHWRGEPLQGGVFSFGTNKDLVISFNFAATCRC